METLKYLINIISANLEKPIKQSQKSEDQKTEKTNDSKLGSFS